MPVTCDLKVCSSSSGRTRSACRYDATKCTTELETCVSPSLELELHLAPEPCVRYPLELIDRFRSFEREQASSRAALLSGLRRLVGYGPSEMRLWAEGAGHGAFWNVSQREYIEATKRAVIGRANTHGNLGVRGDPMGVSRAGLKPASWLLSLPLQSVCQMKKRIACSAAAGPQCRMPVRLLPSMHDA